ncbi:TPA: hypothetical protein ACGVA4_004678 [Vibrio vulnificus]
MKYIFVLFCLMIAMITTGCGNDGNDGNDGNESHHGIYVDDTKQKIIVVDSDLPLTGILFIDLNSNKIPLAISQSHTINGNDITIDDLKYLSIEVKDEIVNKSFVHDKNANANVKFDDNTASLRWKNEIVIFNKVKGSESIIDNVYHDSENAFGDNGLTWQIYEDGSFAFNSNVCNTIEGKWYKTKEYYQASKVNATGCRYNSSLNSDSNLARLFTVDDANGAKTLVFIMFNDDDAIIEKLMVLSGILEENTNVGRQ